MLTGERTVTTADYGDAATTSRDVFASGFCTRASTRPSRPKHGAAVRDGCRAPFVVCAQNHDQVGNRMSAIAWRTLWSTQLRLAAAAIVLSPFIPMLFMGEEYGERRPFQYFVATRTPRSSSDSSARVRAVLEHTGSAPTRRRRRRSPPQGCSGHAAPRSRTRRS